MSIMLALLDQTLPTTLPAAQQAAKAIDPAYVPLVAAAVVAIGPLLTLALNWRYQAVATSLKTYLECYKIAKDAGLAVQDDMQWAMYVMAKVERDVYELVKPRRLYAGLSLLIVLACSLIAVMGWSGSPLAIWFAYCVAVPLSIWISYLTVTGGLHHPPKISEIVKTAEGRAALKKQQNEYRKTVEAANSLMPPTAAPEMPKTPVT